MPETLNHWDDDPALWNRFVLNGAEVPGVATVDCSKGRKLDSKSAPGSDGARIIDKGMAPAKFKVTLLFWTNSHWDTMQQLIRENLPSTSATGRAPVDVSHPTLTVLGIDKAYIEKIDAPKTSNVSGAMQVVIEFIEFKPPTARRSVTRAPSAQQNSDPDRRTAFDPEASNP